MVFGGAGRFWKRGEMRQDDAKRRDSMRAGGKWLGLVVALLLSV